MSDWHKLSAADVELVKSCGPGEVCWLWGDEMVKTTTQQLEAAFEVAFREAYAAALKLGADFIGEQHTFEVDGLEPGAVYLRVIIRNEQGDEASGIGMIPRPTMGVH